MRRGEHMTSPEKMVIRVNGVKVQDIKSARNLIIQILGYEVSYGTVYNALNKMQNTFHGIKLFRGYEESEKPKKAVTVHHPGEPLIPHPVTCGISSNFNY